MSLDAERFNTSGQPPTTPIRTSRLGLPPVGAKTFLSRRSSSTARPSHSPVLGAGPIIFEEGSFAWMPDSTDVVVPVKVSKTFRKGEKGTVVRLHPNEASFHNEEEVARRRKLSIGSRQRHHLRPSVTSQVLTPEQSNSLFRADETSLVPTANMIDMIDLSEATLLHNLRLRFFEKVVYTSIGTILVSVNPFEPLPLYTPEMVEKYRTAGSHFNRSKLGPHVYALAHDAYANMIEHRQDQSCIVTGESGSGKTEFTKLFLQYLMELSKAEEKETIREEDETFLLDKDIEEKGGGVEVNDRAFEDLPLSTRILTANPLLEAFGNAVTTRNDNSSRFGKWISVAFHKKKGSVLGANIQVYLLEKSRLVHRGEGERNFHIFYQLLAAASTDNELRDSLQLTGGVESFKYLVASHADRPKDFEAALVRINDTRAWAQTLRSLRSIGITRDEEGQLLQVLAGLLHLGNVEFVEKAEDVSVVQNMDVLDVAAELLGLDGVFLETSLTKKDISNSKERIFQNRSCSQAREARDALAKFIYSKLFEWVVWRIGSALGPSHEMLNMPRSTIGMLDVFGFEVFERNSFEQLCINYANEKLQEQFNHKVFEMERQEYLAQGMQKDEVDALFSNVSNAECLAMFEDRPNGIFAALEDEIFVPRGTDANFVAKLAKSAPQTCFLKVDELRFRILHYAGEVEYDATNFLEKSRDRIDPLLEQLPARSSRLLSVIAFNQSAVVPPVREMAHLSIRDVPASPRSSPNGNISTPGRKKEQKTLGTKFVVQLGDLLDTLDTTEPHYARCIKPNDLKQPSIFKAHLVMSQLKYAGLLDVCRVRKRGFPVRLDFEEFVWRYGNIVFSAEEAAMKSARDKCEAILKVLKIDKQDAFIGKTKVLLRHSCYDNLESQRDEALKQRVTKIQKVARGRLSRISAASLKSALAKLSQTVSNPSFSESDYKLLEEQLAILRDVPENHPVINAALELKKKLESRVLILDLISKASSPHEASIARKEALAAGISPDDPCLARVNELLAIQTEMSSLRTDLEMAMEMRDLNRLERVLQSISQFTASSGFVSGRNRSVSFTQDQINDARTLVERLRKEKQAVEVVEKAIAEDASIDVLKQSLKTMIALNMDNHPTALAASKLLRKKKRKENESKDLTMLRAKGSEDAKHAITRLKAAETSKDLKALAEARHHALEMGLDRAPDVQRATRLIQQLEDANELETSLAAATDVVQAKAALKNGTSLTIHDVERLQEAIMVAKQRGVPTDSEQYKRAQAVEAQCRAQLKLQLGLLDAMKDRDYSKIRNLLQGAEHMQIDNDLVRRAKAVASKRAGGDNGARIGRTVSLKDRAQEIKRISQKDFEKRRMERLSNARDPSHDWWNLEQKNILRSSDDFAVKRGALFSSRYDRRLARSKWRYTGKIIPKSLTIGCDKEERIAQRALLINKAVLGYCGDLVLPFPSVLAQQILEAALLDPPLADELWVQILRQLTENPYEDSERRAWQLCAVVASCVGPASTEIEDAVLHFLIVQTIEAAGVDPVNKEFARYALRKFERLMLEGPSGAIPTSQEIQAFQERPPMLATVNLPDGRELVRDYPVASDVTVQELVEACCVSFDIRSDFAYLFSLFLEVKSQHVTDRRSRTLKRSEVGSSLESNLSSRTKSSATPVSKPSVKASSNRTVTFDVDPPARPASMMRRVSTSMFRSTDTKQSAEKKPVPATIRENSVVSEETEKPNDIVPQPQVLGRTSSRIKLTPGKRKLRQKQLPDRVPEPLPATDFLGDTFVRHLSLNKGERLQFIFRRKIIPLPGQDPPGSLKEKTYMELRYIEAVEDVLAGNWACATKEEAAELAALLITEERGGKPPSTISPAMSSLVADSFVPATWRKANETDWVKLILTAANRLETFKSRADVRRGFLARVEKLPTYGTINFPVRRGEEELILACGPQGIAIVLPDMDRKQTMIIPHIRVRKITPYSESLGIDVWDASLQKVQERSTFITGQAHEIAALLWEMSIRFN